MCIRDSSWVSLNFQDGRLVLEAAEAKPVPEIAAGTLHGLRAKTAGTVVSTNLVSGTMLVVPGQAVEKGQGLIGTARAERDGTLIFQSAAGSVRAQFEWEFAEDLPLTAATDQLTGNTIVQRRLFLAGRVFPLPSLFSPADDSTAVTRHLQPELLGLTLPLSVEETTYYEQKENEVHFSEDEARALTRLHGLQALQNDYPDAEFVAQKVDVTTENYTLHYRVAVSYTHLDVYKRQVSTRCRATVSSTAPRLDARWPPVFDTLSRRNSRISAQSCTVC